MKKRFRTVIGFLAAAMAVAAGLSACGGSAKPHIATTSGGKVPEKRSAFTFRLAETHPPDYPTTLGDKKFAELVSQKSNGRIKIDVFPNSQLGEEKQVLEQVQLGAIEFSRVSSGPLAEFNKAFGVFSLPYIFDNAQHEWNFLSSADGNKLLEGLSASMMLGLAYYDSGARHFYSSKPLRSPEDLKGQKIRVQQNKVNIALITALGASATPLSYGDVLGALKAGTVEAAENNWPSYDTSKHFQAAPNLILDGHQRVPEVLLISKVTWEKLSPEDKKVIKQAAAESVDYQREQWTSFEKKSEQRMRSAGVAVTEVKDLKPWQDAVKPIIDSYREDYKDVLDAIDKARN
ncbi:TRAP transporter substrate-binding protein [Paenibacillus thalictri]|uniref:TRAP transporter substrate-binding protein n=1 Tax=Paenibacillus thalictri TaxID=2527873 RepID=A0A4Q9DXT1_9BACL|nr:TRAP transporter substrate-binding protein [Paenibacillus thalictri]TBL80673.1 TRAP transporter substrate-binding protein [Paenibacillus thalictri]